MIMCVAPCACIYNDKHCIKADSIWPVDDGKWTSLISFALQFYDFGSDVNLAISAWSYSEGGILLKIAQIGCCAFVIIPYCANLIIAARIKLIIGNNHSAQSFLKQEAEFLYFWL